MKKNRIAFLSFILVSLCSIFMSSCMDDNPPNWKLYKDWREFNENWLNEQATRKNADGTPYYTRCVMPTDPQAYVLMHMIEKSDDPQNTLTPLYSSTVKVNYTLTLANDSVADKGTNYLSQLNSNYITGWSLAIMQLNVGDSAQFILPYNLGYGESGSSSIKPYSNLRFNIRLVDITAYEVRP